MVDPGSWTLDSGSGILDHGSWILDSRSRGSRTLGIRHSGCTLHLKDPGPKGSRIQDLGCRIQAPEYGSWMRDPGSLEDEAGPWIQDLAPWVMDPGSRILDPGPGTSTKETIYNEYMVSTSYMQLMHGRFWLNMLTY